MGLFDWLRRPRSIPVTCWLDEAGRLGALARDVAADLERRERVLLVAHWKQSLIDAGRDLAAAGIAPRVRGKWTAGNTDELLHGTDQQAFAVLAAELPAQPPRTGRPAPAPGTPLVSVRLVDLHLLADQNERVQRFADSLPAPTRVEASLSFGHPLMQPLAADWVKTMMVRMGLRADQPIRSPLVSRSIHAALAKLARKAAGNQPCDSVEEWLQRNVRP